MDFLTDRERKKRKLEDQKDGGFDSLPREISLDIISRLPIESLVQFRFVCKSWYVLSHDHHLPGMHQSRAQKNDPCLILQTENPIRNQLCFVQLSDQHHQNHEEHQKVKKFDPPFASSMPEFTVVGSCNGLLCLSNSLLDDSIYLYNPFTGYHKQLPKTIEFQEQIVVFGFGFHPITKEYKLIKIIYYPGDYNINAGNESRGRFYLLQRSIRSEVLIYDFINKKRSMWRSLGQAPPNFVIDPKSTSPALIKGRIHWITILLRVPGKPRQWFILSFDLADEQFREVSGPDFGANFVKGAHHLTVLRDCLALATPKLRPRDGSLEIWIMTEYDNKDSWVKEYIVRAYSPEISIAQNFEGLRTSYQVWKDTLCRRAVQVLCILKNGEILLEHRCGSLVTYNPGTEVFRTLTFPGMPKLFQTVALIGSLSWIN